MTTSLAEVLSPNPIEPIERPPSFQVLCRYEIGLGSHTSFYLLVIRKFVLAIQLSRGRNIANWRYWGAANLTSINSLLDFDFLAYVIVSDQVWTRYWKPTNLALDTAVT